MYAYCGDIEETADVDGVNEGLEWC